MASTAAAIWLAIVLGALLLVAGPSAPEGGALMAIYIAAAFAVIAATVSIASIRVDLPSWAQMAALSAMTIDVGVIYFFGEALRPEIAMLFVLVAVYCAYFFSWRTLVTDLVLIALVVAVPLVGTGSEAVSGDQPLRLGLLLPAICVTAFLVAFLRNRVENREEEMALQAGQDPVSGLLNATGFAQMLDLETARAMRNDRPVVVLAIEARPLPGAVHPLGDGRLARVIGRSIAGRLDSDDHGARLDDTLFAVSGPDSDALTALSGALTAAIRARLASLGYPDRSIDVLIGRATFPFDSQRPERVVEIARERLAVDLPAAPFEEARIPQQTVGGYPRASAPAA